MDSALTDPIIGAAIEVHRTVGPGLLESAYESCLCHELELRGLRYARQLQLPVIYKGLIIENAYRIDILVEDAIVIELKTVDALLPVHESQLLTYLRFAEKKIGLLINYRTKLLKDGIKRMVL